MTTGTADHLPATAAAGSQLGFPSEKFLALVVARVREIERQSQTYGIGEKNGRAYIVNESHGLNRATVRQLLTTLEGDRIPRHVVWIFTTTVEGEQTLFEGCDDSHPLLSRCQEVALARRDLAKVFAPARRVGRQAAWRVREAPSKASK